MNPMNSISCCRAAAACASKAHQYSRAFSTAKAVLYRIETVSHCLYTGGSSTEKVLYIPSKSLLLKRDAYGAPAYKVQRSDQSEYKVVFKKQQKFSVAIDKKFDEVRTIHRLRETEISADLLHRLDHLDKEKTKLLDLREKIDSQTQQIEEEMDQLGDEIWEIKD